MPAFRYLVLLLFLQLICTTQVQARDFDWLKQLSIEAQADPSGFTARLSTRFHIGDAEVRTVIANVGGQADAYMVMRLAEMSHQPVAYVTKEYQEARHLGWGALARQLGIKPGSRAFHELKAGHDLGMMRYDAETGKGHGRGHGHDTGQGHGRGKHGKGQ